MQMGSGTVGNETVTWQDDGNVIIESNVHRNGRRNIRSRLLEM